MKHFIWMFPLLFLIACDGREPVMYCSMEQEGRIWDSNGGLPGGFIRLCKKVDGEYIWSTIPKTK